MRLRVRRQPGTIYAEYSYHPRRGCGCCGCLMAPVLLVAIGFAGAIRWIAKRILDLL